MGAAAVLSVILLVAGIGTKNGMLGGIAVAVLGIVMLIEAVVTQREYAVWGICVGAVICAMGVVLMLAAWMRRFLWFDEMLEYGICFVGIGLIFFLMLALDVYKIVTCSESVRAQFSGCVWHYGGKSPDTYSATYHIPWQGRQYEATSNLGYSKRKMKKRVTGEWYSVYINPRNPQMVREHRRVTVNDVLFLMIGSLMFVLGIGGILYSL